MERRAVPFMIRLPFPRLFLDKKAAYRGATASLVDGPRNTRASKGFRAYPWRTVVRSKSLELNTKQEGKKAWQLKSKDHCVHMLLQRVGNAREEEKIDDASAAAFSSRASLVST